MDREIKFRQPLWDKHNKFAGWHYWGFIDDGFIGICTEPESSVEEAKRQSQQFTGLLDKNGKEIYEGDIVIIDGGGKIIPVIVSFEDGCYGVTWPKRGVNESRFSELKYYIDMTFCSCEIIGNIFENPELLKTAGTGKG